MSTVVSVEQRCYISGPGNTRILRYTLAINKNSYQLYNRSAGEYCDTISIQTRLYGRHVTATGFQKCRSLTLYTRSTVRYKREFTNSNFNERHSISVFHVSVLIIRFASTYIALLQCGQYGHNCIGMFFTLVWFYLTGAIVMLEMKGFTLNFHKNYVDTLLLQ